MRNNGGAGPALTTAGAPGATSDCILAVGAYVTESMMRTCYSMLKEPTAGYNTNFTWSSVGPADDGGMGNFVMAPGGAITCVPNWALAHSRLMNGTSMSSPNVCGNVALLLSGLKAEGTKYSPHRVQRAIVNTGKTLANVSARAQGDGLLQIDAAFDYVQKYKAVSSEDVNFDVAILGPSPRRGIYLRDACQMQEPSAYMVDVLPRFHEDTDKSVLVDFEMRIRLEADADFVLCPERMVCAAASKSFKCKVDPTKLAPGLHCATIRGYDAEMPERGPLFSVPITVTKPAELVDGVFEQKLQAGRGGIHRMFVTPPAGATWMDISVKLNNTDPSGEKCIIVLHTMQLLPHRRYPDGETKDYLRLKTGGESVVSRKVDGTGSIELCLATYWSTTASVQCTIVATFHSALPSASDLTLTAGSGHAQVHVHAPLRDILVNPDAKLDKWRTALRPTSSTITPLTEEYDLLEGQKIHELVMEYTFEADEATEITPVTPGLNSKVYDSVMLGGPFSFVLDSEKKLLGYGDIYPEPIKVPKGKITIRSYLRHTSVDHLKRYKALTLLIERKVAKPVKLSCFDRYERLVTNGTKFSKRALPAGQTCAVFVAEPEHSALPKKVKAGDVLLGTISYATADEKFVGAGKRPKGFPVTYVVPPAPNKEEEKKTAEAPDKRSELEKMEDAIRDLTVKKLKDLGGKETFDAIYTVAKEKYPDHLPVLQAYLKHVDTASNREKQQADIVAAADAVIAMINADQLATHFGTNSDKDDVQAAKLRKEMTTQKEALIDALARKARAIGSAKKVESTDAAESQTKESGEDTFEDTFDSVLKELKKWDTVDATNHLHLSLEADVRAKRYGSVLKSVKAAVEKSGNSSDAELKKELKKYKAEAYVGLGWAHAANENKNWELLDAPAGYPLF